MTVAYVSRGSKLWVDGAELNSCITISVDRDRLRGRAISNGSQIQVALRAAKIGDRFHLKLETPERIEFDGMASLRMYRVRLHFKHAIAIGFMFDLES